MFTTSDIFEKIYQNWWGILLYCLILWTLYTIYNISNTTLEGFESGNIKVPDEYKAHLCYGIKQTLDGNKSLIEGLTERHAAESLEDVNNLISMLTGRWNEFDCETVLSGNPIPLIHIPNRADIEEAIKDKVTAQIEAAIAVKEAAKKN